MIRAAIAVVLISVLAGCSSLPRSGPSDRRIVGSAAAALTVDSRATTVQYALVDLTPSVIAQVPDYTVSSLYKSFGLSHGGPGAIAIGVGDQVQVTIYESSDGGLFIPEGGGGSSGNFVSLPAQIVSSSGVITVPFAGAIKARGLTVPQLEEAIRDRLAARAIEPQVIVSLSRRTASEVTVLGDVASSQKISISEAGERVLDVIARAGGITKPPYETFVSITRNGRKGQVYFNTLAENSRENIYVVPGDLVVVESSKRSFTAFGSTGLTGEFNFGAESIYLDTAVAKAGGLSDGRANPRQVFLYREEERGVLQAMGVDLRAFPPQQSVIATVYRANFTDPASFFLARRFAMRNADVIYISNADSVELTKFLGLVNLGGGTVTTVNGAVLSTQQVVNN